MNIVPIYNVAVLPPAVHQISTEHELTITEHGTKDILYRGTMTHDGQTLVFHGWTRGHVMRKAEEWLFEHAAVSRARIVVSA